MRLIIISSIIIPTVCHTVPGQLFYVCDFYFYLVFDKLAQIKIPWVQIWHNLLKYWIRNIINRYRILLRLYKATTGNARYVGIGRKHGLEFITELRYYYLMPIKRLTFNHKSHIGKLSLIQHAVYTGPQSILLLCLIMGFLDSACEIRTWIGIKNIHILQIILPITTPNNVQFTINKCHRVSGSSIWIRIVFGIQDVVAMFPWRRFWIKCIQIIETVGVRSTPSKEIELIADIAKFHARSGCWALAYNFYLGPSEGRYLEYK